MDKGSIIIGKGQVISFIAFHLIRFWPDPVPPDLEHILLNWTKITEKDFDDFDQQEIKIKELSSYIKTTLNANRHYRELVHNENFNENEFLISVCKSILNEIKELKE